MSATTRRRTGVALLVVTALLLAATAVGSGGQLIAVALVRTAPGRGALLLGGIASSVLGVLVLARWPEARARALGRERSDGPSLDGRKIDRDAALFAIRNGGFSGERMPANIVKGDDAEAVARFVARYAGRNP